MELNKCTRCGSFHTSESNVCPTCKQKDIADIYKLKGFLSENDMTSIDDISYQTGITAKNLNRFFELDEFRNLNCN